MALGFHETPFKVWIVFISLKIFNGKWGIRSMMKASKDYEVPIVLMANGDFQFRVSDVTAFYTQIIGGMSNFSTGDVNAFMKSFINEQITQQLTHLYYMEIMNNLEQASSSTKILIDPYFTQRGIELLSMKISNVSTTDEDREKVFQYLQFSSANGEAFKKYEVMDRMADAVGDSSGGAAVGTGMLLFPQMFQQMQQNQQQQPQNQQQQPQKVMCPYCGSLNTYPYKFCSSCGKPSPMTNVNAQGGMPSPATSTTSTPVIAGNTEPPKFKVCPYCGQNLEKLPKTPKFCPFCSEQLY